MTQELWDLRKSILDGRYEDALVIVDELELMSRKSYIRNIAVAKAVRIIRGKRAFNSVFYDFIAVLSSLSVAILGISSSDSLFI